jgi:hypothetical protein
VDLKGSAVLNREENTMPERTAKEELVHLLANMDSSNVDMVVDAIEALIQQRISEALNMTAEQRQGLAALQRS